MTSLYSQSHKPVLVDFFQMSQIDLSLALLITASTTTLSLIFNSFQYLFSTPGPLEMSPWPVNPLIACEIQQLSQRQWHFL